MDTCTVNAIEVGITMETDKLFQEKLIRKSIVDLLIILLVYKYHDYFPIYTLNL